MAKKDNKGTKDELEEKKKTKPAASKKEPKGDKPEDKSASKEVEEGAEEAEEEVVASNREATDRIPAVEREEAFDTDNAGFDAIANDTLHVLSVGMSNPTHTEIVRDGLAKLNTLFGMVTNQDFEDFEANWDTLEGELSGADWIDELQKNLYPGGHLGLSQLNVYLLNLMISEDKPGIKSILEQLPDGVAHTNLLKKFGE